MRHFPYKPDQTNKTRWFVIFDIGDIVIDIDTLRVLYPHTLLFEKLFKLYLILPCDVRCIGQAYRACLVGPF